VNDEDKTKEQLMNELFEMRRIITELQSFTTEHMDVEEILRKNEERLRKNEFITDVFKEYMTLIDRDYVYESANEAYCKAYGKARSEIIGKTVADVWGQESFNSVIKNFLDQCFMGNEVRYEAWFTFKETQRCYNVSYYPYFDNQGEVTHIVVISYDVTERKQFEQDLQAEREKFRTLSEHAPFGMVMIDKHGMFTYTNPKFKELFGYGLEDIPDGKTWFRKVYPDPAYRHDVISTWIKDFGDTQLGEKIPRIFIVTCRDGSERLINFISVQLKADEKLIVCEDITERKRIEKALQESEEKYRSIFEHAVDGIFQSTPDGRYIDVSPSLARMLGFESPQEVRTNITDIGQQLYVEPSDHAKFKKILEERGVVNGFVTQFYRKDRSKIWVSVDARAVRNSSGVLLYYEGFNENITEQKSAEEALNESLESLQRILDGTVNALTVSVEMRDPYTAGHQKRVAQLACSIAQGIGFSEHQIEGIRITGFLHDVGKIVVPAEVLSKPTKLNEYEFSMIKAHAQAGFDILKRIEFPWPVAEAVLQHHERLDGSGYPSGLSGKDIILEARILAVADVVEAMISHRPYRPAFSVDYALEEVIKNKAILYDPELVEACIKLFKERQFKFLD
jgi:PAS domain S-box-containing protein/putative nucleotidyltransferase with HDIG domain